MKEKLPFYIIVISIFLGVVSFNLLSDGMFFDGVFYASFSKVMGLNFESFWIIKSCSSCPNVYGHPPLAIFLESLFFRIFGDSLYIERVYSLGTYFISGFLIFKVIKEIRPNYHNSWFAILLWIITPLVTWGAANNVLENTMTVFILFSVLFFLKSLKQNRLLYTLLAGLFIFFAFLSKGFVALFPLFIFVLHWLILKKTSLFKTILSTFILVMCFIIPILLIYLFDVEAWNYLSNYYYEQVLFSVQNTKTVDSRFFIIYSLLSEILAPLVLCLILLISYRNVIEFKKWKKDYSWGIFFLLLGFSGVFPMMISLKQSAFYIISTLPLFAIGISFMLMDQTEKLTALILKNFSLKKLQIFSLGLLLVSLFLNINQIGKFSRDEEKIKDVYKVIEYVGNKQTLSISHELFWDWSLKAYFYRYGDIDLSSKHEELQLFLLINKDRNYHFLNEYNIEKCKLNNYNLYKLK